MKNYHSTSYINTKQIALVASGLLICFAGSVQAGPTLNFSSYSQVYGNLNTSYSSPLLGDVSFTLNGASGYGSNGSLAQASYSVPSNETTTDPIYNIVTDNGQYGFSYSGKSQVLGTKLKTDISSSVFDSSGAQVNSASNTQVSAYSYAQWNQGFYIAPTAAKAAGSYGAILVKINLDGDFPALSDPNLYNNSNSQLYGSTNFTDTAGVSYSSSFNIYANSGSWTGQETAYKKLLFQYGTTFNISFYQWTSSYNNGEAHFFNTGKISAIELPFGAVLESGAQQAGVGDLTELYGNVYNSATADAENTNWDFGNNGGGFTPPPEVPVPSAVWLFGSGLLGLLGMRQRKANKA